MIFRKIVSFLFVIILLQTFSFNISALYFFDNQNDADNIRKDLYYIKTNQLPFIFLEQQNSSETLKLDSAASCLIIRGTIAKNVIVPIFDLKNQTRYLFIKQYVPLFIKGCSLLY